MRALDYDELLKAACEDYFKDLICSFLDGRAWVEAEPIRHGHWEYWAGHLVKCSVCGHEYTDWLECDNYCGNCGAKMENGG